MQAGAGDATGSQALSTTRRWQTRFNQRLFDAIYRRSLVYNTCWEDPAVDRLALDITPDDVMLVITSAGCNVLDYALEGPACIHAVDANPRQSALLELKQAAIRTLDYEDFFALFGSGRHRRIEALYRDLLRAQLGGFSREFWDRHWHWFAPTRASRSFYFRGLSGAVAHAFGAYLALRPALGRAVRHIFDAVTLEQQRDIYDRQIAPRLWSPALRWLMSRQLTMNMLGVPQTQREQVEAQHQGGVAGFVREAMDYVFRQLPVHDNYFWRLYVFGGYGEQCCPRYLQPDGFALLKRARVDLIRSHTCTVTEFLEECPSRISKFVLLDHMDWMSTHFPQELAREWQAIHARATPAARIIFRSAHANPAYLHSTRVPTRNGSPALAQMLHLHRDLAEVLQRRDRVHTYAGFHIATLAA